MKSVINNIKSYILDNLVLIRFGLFVYIIEFITRYFCNINPSKLSILLDLFYIVLVISFIGLFNGKIKKALSILLLAIYSFYNFAQVMHYNFFLSFYSLKKLSIASELEGVLGEAFTKLKPEYLLFLLPIVVYAILIKTKNNNYNFLTGLAFFILSCFFVFLANNALVKYMEYTTPDVETEVESDLYLYTNFSSNIRFYERFGSFEFIENDIKRLNKSSNVNLSEEETSEIDNFINTNSKTNSNMYGKYKDKNVILILCESLGDIEFYEDLMPTLYKLTNEGYYFDNFYAPLYASNTCDSEFISLTGMIPSIDYGTTSTTFYSNSYPYSLPNLFKKNGYEVNSYHSFYKEFYNREKFHEALGFEKLYDIEDLELYLDSGLVEFTNWPNDEDLFVRTLENTNYENKFFDFIITTSGHMPYSYNRTELLDNYYIVDEKYPELADSNKWYYAAQMKLDQGLEALLNKLENEGILDDTIIILFGDHYPYGLWVDRVDELYNFPENDYEKYRTPFLIYDSQNKGEISNKLSSTFDIYPTIVSLFGLEDEGAFVVGEDIFNTREKEIVLFSDKSVLANDFYYDSSSSSINGVDKYSLLDLSDKYYKYSQLILAGDYFKGK